MNDSSRTKELDALTNQVRKLNKNMQWHATFVRGIATGFGTAIGAGIIVTIAVVVLNKLTGLPLLGSVFAYLASHLK